MRRYEAGREFAIGALLAALVMTTFAAATMREVAQDLLPQSF